MSLPYFTLLFYSGACWGSFLLATYIRNKAGQSIVLPRSHCDFCQTSLPYFSLFPIFSYLLSNACCIFCYTPIPSSALFVEALSGGIFLLISPVLSLNPFLISCLLLLSFLAIEDLATQNINTQLLLFPALINVRFNFSLHSFILLIILIIFLFLNFEDQITIIGQGDIETILFLLIIFSIERTSLIILIASGLAILRLIFSNLNKIPYIPYIFSVSLFLTLYF